MKSHDINRKEETKQKFLYHSRGLCKERKIAENLIDFKYKQTIGFHLCLFIRLEESKENKRGSENIKVGCVGICFATLNFMRLSEKFLFILFLFMLYCCDIN